MSRSQKSSGAKTQPTVPSRIMEKLYGGAYASKVHERLESLDPELNAIIQRVPYEQFWTRGGLSIRDKSLITVAALIAMGKEEQTRIHMTGFLNAGGTLDELRNSMIHLAIYCGFPATMNGFAALKEVVKNQKKTSKSSQRKRK